jgi:hypothetical protein
MLNYFFSPSYYVKQNTVCLSYKCFFGASANVTEKCLDYEKPITARHNKLMLSVRDKCRIFYVPMYQTVASTNSNKNSKYELSRESVQCEYWCNKRQDMQHEAGSL